LVLHAQEARNTTLVALESTLATRAFADALAKPSRPAWARYGLLAATLVYTHDVGFLVLAGHVLFALIGLRGRAFAGFALTLALVGLAYLPWLPSAALQATQYRTYLPSTFSLP